MVNRSLWVVLTLVLAPWASAQAQGPQNAFTFGTGYYQPDITGVYSHFEKTGSAGYGQSSRFSPSANWNGKYVFTQPIDDQSAFKISLADDGWYGFYSGDVVNRAGEAYQNAGLVTPAVEIDVNHYTLNISFPMYYYGPANAGGYSQLIYAYREASLLPINHANSTNPQDVPDTGVVFTTCWQAAQKFVFDDTTWVSIGLSGLLALTPQIWPTDLLPRFNFGIWGIELDTQYDLYHNYNDGSPFISMFLEQKLIYDLGFLSLVPGLKPYVMDRLSLATTNPAYTVNGSTQDFHNAYWQLGVIYEFAVAQVGAFTVDAGWRFDRFTDVGALGAANTATYSDPASNVNDQVPYSELRIGVSYTFGY